MRRLLGHREGMVLVTGPTGSGKTTTLYAALNELKTGKVNIVTVEDPVEYDVAGISQIQVSEAQGLTFAKALRSVLRQDPDIVLVGEIRDLETATTAVQAGFSGHFVLSTLHTNDAPSAVVRLRDMGIDAFKVATVLKGVVAQRLVRKLCHACAETVPVEALPPDARPPASRTGAVIRRAVGCRACDGTRLSRPRGDPRDHAGGRDRRPPDRPGRAARCADRRGAEDRDVQRCGRAGSSGCGTGMTSLEEVIRVLGERVQDDGRPAVAPTGRVACAGVRCRPPRRSPPIALPPAEARGPGCGSWWRTTIPRCAA